MSIKTLSTKLSAIAGALLLAGCVSVGPDYQAPEMVEVSLSAKAEQNQQVQAIDQQWWNAFDDEDLSQLIAIADQHNPSLAIAKGNVNRATAIFDDVEDNDWPVGGVTGNYTAQRQVFPGPPGFAPDRVSIRSRQLGLNAGWTIDVAGKLERAEQAANADREAAIYAWHEAKLALLSNVANTYISFRGLQARLDVAETTLASLQKTQKIVDAQVEAGFATKLDAYRITAQVANVEASIPQLRATTEQTKQALIALVGGEQLVADIEWNKTQLPVLSAPLPLEDSSNFLQRRPDVLAAERRLASATANIGVATADLYPSLSMNGFLGFFSTQGSVLSGNAKAWSIAPTLNWEVLDLDSVRARIRLADADKEVVLAQFEQTVLNAIAESKTALSNYTELQRSLDAINLQVSANASALELARVQYQNGAIGLLDLLDVERQWLAARDQQADAKAQLAGALVDIYTALGGGVITA
jgi:multidrug efflux system outer membrane protein